MDIAIFGDSFACSRKFNLQPSWIDIISDKYNKVVNYAMGGSSLYYSMNFFEKHHFHYDRIIFVVTCPGRMMLPPWPSLGIEPGHRNIPGLPHTEMLIKHALEEYPDIENHTQLKHRLVIWQALADYFKYVQFDDFDNYIHNLMFDRITQLRPDAIVIPSFKTSHSSFKDKTSMCDIQKKEDHAWNFLGGIIAGAKDFRNCHMTSKNNEIFAGKVEEWLHGAPVDINLDDFAIPTIEEKDYYIKS